MNRRQWLLLALALLALGIVKLVVLRWYWQSGQDKSVAQTLPCAAGATSCALPGGGTLRFFGPIVVGQPFVIELTGVGGEEPAAEFSMQSMDMGFNRYRFVRSATGWRARATLPVCVTGRRDWQMVLLLNGQRYRLPLQVK
ncbi:hypothetical protein THUN1379_29800 [Paludibacterium sp. THUN1379]|uniref:hypothetical protein n=1 Tax=Paludibacterium sp. THUN1379 TaxID=3112107 RepID=UPI00308959CC|nr:hypothetical protein THUN1379_29800 [Paludibacterium sp. THUN1379]